ncbi:MAG: hypothetical protein E7159_06205 [Firmicutes bacterium]|nr:hypothetical protein [Bacillota bacterium]
MKITIDEKAIQEKRNLLRKERRHKIKSLKEDIQFYEHQREHLEKLRKSQQTKNNGSKDFNYQKTVNMGEQSKISVTGENISKLTTTYLSDGVQFRMPADNKLIRVNGEQITSNKGR